MPDHIIDDLEDAGFEVVELPESAEDAFADEGIGVYADEVFGMPVSLTIASAVRHMSPLSARRLAGALLVAAADAEARR